MRRSLSLIIASLLLIAVVSFAIVMRERDRNALDALAKRNCEQIETLKVAVRPEPFDEVETRAILADLNIDPESDHAKRLIQSARRNNARERRELAPKEC